MWLPGGGKWEKGHTEYVLPCPQCKAKFAWNPELQKGHCWSCKLAAGGEGAYRKLFGHLGGDEVSWKADFQRMPFHSFGLFEPTAVSYAASRGVSRQVLNDCGALMSGCRLYFPIQCPFTGRVMLMSRDIREGQKGWKAFPGPKSKFIFNGYACQWRGCVTLVEGIFDVLSPQLQNQAIAVLGKVLDFNLKLWVLATWQQVNIWFDPDEPGIAGAIELEAALNKLSGGRNHIVRIQATEPGETAPRDARRILQEVYVGEA